MIWDRPPISYFYAAIEDKTYLEGRGEYINQENKIMTERVNLINSKLDAIIWKLEKLKQQQEEAVNKEHDRFYKRITADHRQWKENQ